MSVNCDGMRHDWKVRRHSSINVDDEGAVNHWWVRVCKRCGRSQLSVLNSIYNQGDHRDTRRWKDQVRQFLARGRERLREKERVRADVEHIMEIVEVDEGGAAR